MGSQAAGSRIGPYEVVAPIGSGGMGEVFRARDSRLGRDVAIKVLPPSLTGDPDRLARFEQEARATSALNHPNILTVHDIGTHEGAPYLVAELLEGEELVGKYVFSLFGLFPMDETDRVVFRIAEPRRTVTGLLGGSLTYDLTGRSGLRIEARLHLSSNNVETTLTTAPVVVTSSPGSVLPTSATTSPGLQFSAQSGVRSTLSGPAASLTLSTSSGFNRQASVTIGLFRRF